MNFGIAKNLIQKMMSQLLHFVLYLLCELKFHLKLVKLKYLFLRLLNQLH